VRWRDTKGLCDRSSCATLWSLEADHSESGVSGCRRSKSPSATSLGDPPLVRHCAEQSPQTHCLKRAYGVVRCTWRGLDHVGTYVWSAVVAHNWCSSPALNWYGRAGPDRPYRWQPAKSARLPPAGQTVPLRPTATQTRKTTTRSRSQLHPVPSTLLKNMRLWTDTSQR
jgi:hypothetical protein